MIILDTNVLSALMQSTPEPIVIAWLDGLPGPSIWTTAITVFEIRMGLALLPAGRRRDGLETAFTRALDEALARRILPFDESAARHAGEVGARRQRDGLNVDLRDTQIAGIALARRAAVATRNVRHFADLGVAVLNPWDGQDAG
jgi:predicted nucleic acid-binding protein